jgi:hypothetical protein
VPVLTTPVDVMRVGLGAASVKAAQGAHPVEQIQAQQMQVASMTQKQMLAKVYGAHMPLQQTMEENILAQFRRFPGLPSSMAGLETMCGADTTMAFDDYLGAPALSTEPVAVFEAMERRLGDKLL